MYFISIWKCRNKIYYYQGGYSGRLQRYLGPGDYCYPTTDTHPLFLRAAS